MDDVSSSLRKAEDVHVLVAEANPGLEAEIDQDPNLDPDQDLLVVHDHPLHEDHAPGPSPVTEEGPDPGLVSEDQGRWKGKMEVQTKDPLPEAEVAHQKEADPDLNLRTGKIEMETNLITKI